MSFVETSSPAAASIDFVPAGAVNGPSAGPQSIVVAVVGRSFENAQTRVRRVARRCRRRPTCRASRPPSVSCPTAAARRCSGRAPGRSGRRRTRGSRSASRRVVSRTRASYAGPHALRVRRERSQPNALVRVEAGDLETGPARRRVRLRREHVDERTGLPTFCAAITHACAAESVAAAGALPSPAAEEET